MVVAFSLFAHFFGWEAAFTLMGSIIIVQLNMFMKYLHGQFSLKE
jgi:uncharacterized membrane protein